MNATRILVVDDFDDNRELYAEYLRAVGFEVEEAKNGLEACEKARALLPDLIVMDLSLPVMDGWEATRRLKRERATRAIPVLALTGNALVGHSEQALRAGCDAFVTKPCLPQALRREILRMLGSPPSGRPAGRAR